MENFGSQCGYCTPGFIMSLFEGYYRKDLKTGAQLDEQLCGNLCRCTGYRADPRCRRRCFRATQRHGCVRRAAKKFQTATERRALPIAAPKIFCVRRRSRNCSLRWRNILKRGLIAGATELGLDITKALPKISDADFGRSDFGTDGDHDRPDRMDDRRRDNVDRTR